MMPNAALLAATLALGSALPVFAIDEDDFDILLDQVVEPWCEDNRVTGSFQGIDEVSIASARYKTDATRGALVVLVGQNDTYLQDCELAYDMRDLGYELFVIDGRGSGMSEHLLEDTMKAHVVDDPDFVQEVQIFVDSILPTG